MRITLLTVGTRGDVQPFVALALELEGRGHTVTLAAPTDTRALVEDFGVSYAPLRANLLALAASSEGQAAVHGNPLAIRRLMREVVRPGVRAMLDDATKAAQGADTLVFHPKALAGRHLAEALDVPGWVVGTVPLLVSTRAFPAPVTVTRDLGPLNPLTYRIADLAEAPVRSVLADWRRDLGLRSLPARGQRAAGGRTLPVLYAHSRHLVPTPPDWDAGVHVTGFWTVPEAALPPLADELRAFLEAGPPPVVLGFGSMGGGADDPLRLAAGALRPLGLRGIVLGLPGRAQDGVIGVAEAPHGRLFPGALATVHHGGAGTTAASLLAGVPGVLVPHGLDQPFWAARVRALDVGTVLARRQLTGPNLRTAFKHALRPDVRARTSALGALLRTEGGAALAADLIGGGHGSGGHLLAERRD